jgi:hypothetical protein
MGHSGPVLLALLVAVLAAAPGAEAGLTVYDRVTSVDFPVFLKVETRRYGFPEGGTRVRLFLDGRPLGEILTGGDGRGYLKYTPPSSGQLRITARWHDAEDTGRLLVVGPREKTVVVEMDAALRANALDLALREGSAAALETLSRRYRLIYLSSLLGAFTAEKWLAETGLPQAVVLRNRGEVTFTQLAAHGVHPFAVIGSAALMTAGLPQVKHRISFEKTPDGKTVKDWPAALEALEK